MKSMVILLLFFVLIGLSIDYDKLDDNWSYFIGACLLLALGGFFGMAVFSAMTAGKRSQYEQLQWEINKLLQGCGSEERVKALLNELEN